MTCWPTSASGSPARISIRATLLGELAVFAGGHPQRVMLLCYLLAEQLERAPGTVETAESVVQDAIDRTERRIEALWSQLRRSERVVLAGVADGRAARESRAGRRTPAGTQHAARGRRATHRSGAPRARRKHDAGDRPAPRASGSDVASASPGSRGLRDTTTRSPGGTSM